MELSVVKLDGTTGQQLAVSEDIFAAAFREPLVHQVVVAYLSGTRSGTSSQKNRSDVSGGGSKPWRQKGTGRARSGNTRSPIWRGGMTVFGPSPRSYAFNLSKKSKKLAIKSVLTDRFKNKNIAVIDSILLDKPKTKDAAAMLKKLSLPNKTLFIISEKNPNFQLAVRNLPHVNVLLVDGLNVFDLLKHEKIVCTKDALQRIEERLN